MKFLFLLALVQEELVDTREASLEISYKLALVQEELVDTREASLEISYKLALVQERFGPYRRPCDI